MSDPDPPGRSEEDQPAPAVKPLPGALAFAGMGTTAAACVAVGVVLGIWADRSWHTSPILLIVGLVIGVAAAVTSVVGQIRRYL
jgi:hypothetical protein